MPAVSKLASYPIGIYYVRWHFTCSVVIPISIVPHVVGRERGGDLGKLLWPEAKTHPTMWTRFFDWDARPSGSVCLAWQPKFRVAWPLSSCHKFCLNCVPISTSISTSPRRIRFTEWQKTWIHSKKSFLLIIMFSYQGMHAGYTHFFSHSLMLMEVALFRPGFSPLLRRLLQIWSGISWIQNRTRLRCHHCQIRPSDRSGATFLGARPQNYPQ